MACCEEDPNGFCCWRNQQTAQPLQTPCRFYYWDFLHRFLHSQMPAIWVPPCSLSPPAARAWDLQQQSIPPSDVHMQNASLDLHGWLPLLNVHSWLSPITVYLHTANSIPVIVLHCCVCISVRTLQPRWCMPIARVPTVTNVPTVDPKPSCWPLATTEAPANGRCRWSCAHQWLWPLEIPAMVPSHWM